MERFLLKFNEGDYQHARRQISNAISDAQKVVDQINEICSVKVDDSQLKNLLLQDGGAIASAIKKAVTQDLDKAGISSATVRDAAVKGDLEKYYKIINQYERPDYLSRKYLSIDEEGKVTCLEEHYENLKEEHSYYIKTEKGLEAYHAHLKLVEAINSFRKVCPGVPLRIDPILYALGPDNQTFVLNENGVDYDRLANVTQ